MPIVLRRYHLIPGTGGPGRNRGGLALRLDFEFAHPHSIVTARGMERFRLAPWGLYGGRAGTSGSCVVNRGTPPRAEHRQGRRPAPRARRRRQHLRAGRRRLRRSARARPRARPAPTCGPGSVTVAQAREQYGVVLAERHRWTRRPPPPRGRPCPRPSRGCSTSGPGREGARASMAPGAAGCRDPAARERAAGRPRLGQAPDLRPHPGRRRRAYADRRRRRATRGVQIRSRLARALSAETRASGGLGVLTRISARDGNVASRSHRRSIAVRVRRRALRRRAST